MGQTSEVVKERLIFVDLKNHNNKFWEAELNDTVVRTRWGRVGTVGQAKNATFTTAEAAERNFNSQVKGKLKKGYTKQHTIEDGNKPNLSFIAKVQIEHDDNKETKSLIDFLIQRNIHKIEGATSIRVEAGRLTTPLGPVTSEGIEEAQKLLLAMAKPRANLDTLADGYLRIVPRNVPVRQRLTAKDLFGTERQREEQQALLDSLRAVVTDMEQQAKVKVKDQPVVFETKLEHIDSSDKLFDNFSKLFLKTLNRNHTSSSLKLHKLWKMEIAVMNSKFEEKLGNVMGLWHGTKDVNLLSILKNGFVIPKSGSGIAVTGRMYGDGVYFSDQSTKSLNYANGYWGAKSNRIFMLFNDVAMGKVYTPSGGFRGNGQKGYDSTFAKAGKSGVMNNEMIVYRTSQIKPQYLLEFR